MALASGGKIAGLPRNVVYAGAAALLLGVAYFWWRSRKGGQSGAGDSALAPSPAGDGTAGGMTDNFFITIQEQQETQPHGPRPHRHPHPKRDHQRPPQQQQATPRFNPRTGGRGGMGAPPVRRG